MRKILFATLFLFTSGVVFAACTHTADEDAVVSPDQRIDNLRADITPMSEGGVGGTVSVSRTEDNTLRAAVNLERPLTVTEPVEARIMEGTCNNPGQLVASLGAVQGTSQEYSLNMTMEELLSNSTDVIAAIPSPGDQNTFLSCGSFERASLLNINDPAPTPVATPLSSPIVSPLPDQTANPDFTSNPDFTPNPTITPHPPVDTGGYF